MRDFLSKNDSGLDEKIDVYEQWEKELEESVSDYLGGADTSYYTEYAGRSFENFKARNPYYLVDLNDCIKNLYSLYDMISRKRYSKLEHNETIMRLGFGMLMRHALEAISVELMIRNKLDAKGKTVHQRLSILNGQIIPGYSKETEKILFDALALTNEVAHPHVTTNVHAYEELHNFYTGQFEAVIRYYAANSSKRRIRNYLAAIHKRLNNFSVRDKITRTLMLGCLVRQLTECTTNRWCYSKELVPTDDSTQNDPIGISLRLTDLNRIVRDEYSKFGHSVSTLDKKVIRSLFAMKNVSNCLMHVTADDIRLGFLKQKGKELRSLHYDVVSQCSPGALELKFDVTARNWKTFWATVLCGLLGWTGAHHFYAGNTGRGFAF